MNDQDIDNLYPSSARPSGLEVPTDLEIKALKEQVESLEKQCAAMWDAFEYVATFEHNLDDEKIPCDWCAKLENALSTADRDYFKVCPKCGYEKGK